MKDTSILSDRCYYLFYIWMIVMYMDDCDIDPICISELDGHFIALYLIIFYLDF